MFNKKLYESRMRAAQTNIATFLGGLSEESKLEKMTKELTPLRTRIAGLRDSFKKAKGDGKQQLRRQINQLTLSMRKIRQKYGQID